RVARGTMGRVRRVNAENKRAPVGEKPKMFGKAFLRQLGPGNAPGVLLEQGLEIRRTLHGAKLVDLLVGKALGPEQLSGFAFPLLPAIGNPRFDVSDEGQLEVMPARLTGEAARQIFLMQAMSDNEDAAGLRLV